MRIFKNRSFARFARKEAIEDEQLEEAVNLLETGQADANLGGNVYKIRMARPGQGKSGGYRVIVVFRSKQNTFYMHGFAKSEKDNISLKELTNLKKQANSLLSLSDDQISYALKLGEFEEIPGGKS